MAFNFTNAALRKAADQVVKEFDFPPDNVRAAVHEFMREMGKDIHIERQSP